MAQVILSIGFGAFGLVFYLVSKGKSKEKSLLETAQEFKSIGDLTEQLQSTNNPSEGIYAYVSGKVEAPTTILRDQATESGSFLKSIIYKKSKILVSEVWRSSTWIREEKTISENFRSVPFFLVDSTGKLFMKLDEASERMIPLKTVYSNFIYNTPTVAHQIVDVLFSSRRDIGLLDEEKILAPSSKLTVIGQAIFDKATRSFAIQRPDDGKPLIIEVGMKSKFDIINSYSSSQNTYFTISIVFFSLAAGLGAYYLYKRYQEKKKESLPIGQGTCCVCLNEKSNILFANCGHICCCRECSRLVNRCPVCRSRITQRTPIIVS